MLIGVPTEIKNNEYRVAATPAGVAELVAHGHQVVLQAGAGAGSSFTDEEYAAAGAAVVADAADAWAAELVLKVKEPIASEYRFLREDLTLFTYLHLAADPDLVEALVESSTRGIAYETVQLADGSLPLLTPMSEIAGSLAAQIGAVQLMSSSGGRGLLLGGVPGTPNGKFVVLGGGTAGEYAARIALGMGADVTILDISLPRLRQLHAQFGGHVTTLRSSPYVVAEEVADADVVVGAVLVPGAAAPKLVTNDMVATMKAGSVLVDIAIDQGGCFEDSHPTTHDNPTFSVHNSRFYCVANMPGSVPRTSTIALTNATLPFTLELANLGPATALERNEALGRGVNTEGGKIVNTAVAQAYSALRG